MKIFKYFRTPKQAVTLEKHQGRGSRIMTKGSERVSRVDRDFKALTLRVFTLHEKAINIRRMCI